MKVNAAYELRYKPQLFDTGIEKMYPSLDESNSLRHNIDTKIKGPTQITPMLLEYDNKIGSFFKSLESNRPF